MRFDDVAAGPGASGSLLFHALLAAAGMAAFALAAACSSTANSTDGMAVSVGGPLPDAGQCASGERDRCGDCGGGDARLKVYYVDADGDGLGDSNAPVAFCGASAPAGHVAVAGDCNDQRFACGSDCKRCKSKLRLRPGTKLTGSSSNLAGATFRTAALANVGDVNGDGVTDLMVGSRLIFLRANGEALGTRQFSEVDVPGETVGTSLGSSVAALGDIDRDGVPDVALASGQLAWVLRLDRSGAPKGVTQHAFVPTSGAPCSEDASYSTSVAGVDLDGDGVSELVTMSSEDCIEGKVETGRIDLNFLARDGSSSMRTSLRAADVPYSRGQFRGALATGIEMPGDAARRSAAVAVSVVGAAWVINLRATGVPATMARITGDGFDERNGSKPIYLGTSGDLDQNQQAELITTLYGAPAGGLAVFQLASDGVAMSSVKLAHVDDGLGAALAEGDDFGAAFAHLGDLDGDGLAEIAVLAPGDDTMASDAGAVHIMHFEAACAPGPSGSPSQYGDCNGTLRDGCETKLVSTEHCGACGFSCERRPHTTGGACNLEGTCELVCERNFADCDGNAANGCELSGAGFANAVSVSCRENRVLLTCAAPFGDCNGDAADGCEADLSRDAENCGRCGNACGIDPITHHASAGCVAAQCTNSPTACGGGWNRCSAGQQLDGTGPCDVCAASCEQELAGFPAPRPCGAHEQCTLTQRYPQGSSSPIRGAVCMATCEVGRGDCDGNLANGCETDLTTEAACGACTANCGIWEYHEYCVKNAEGTKYECRL